MSQKTEDTSGLDERLDEILTEFAEANGVRLFGWHNNGDRPTFKTAKAKIEADYIPRATVMEIIGKNEKRKYEPADNLALNIRNKLRFEQRKALAALQQESDHE